MEVSLPFYVPELTVPENTEAEPPQEHHSFHSLHHPKPLLDPLPQDMEVIYR